MVKKQTIIWDEGYRGLIYKEFIDLRYVMMDWESKDTHFSLKVFFGKKETIL